jgi:PIN domain nuclease of toxin-antitoxin system
MATVTYLDTHVVAWLYGAARAELSAAAEETLRDQDLRISPMVRLELQYLYELGRVGSPAGPVLDALSTALGITVCRASFPAVVARAEGETWTRDPFDRLIVAQAALNEARLVTKDAVIRQNYGRAVW